MFSLCHYEMIPVMIFLVVLFCLFLCSAADPSKDSFFRLFTHLKIVLICFAIFTLSSGLGFLDATLSIYAIDTVKQSIHKG